MTILALAARVDLLAPVVLRVRLAPLGPVVPPPGREVLRVAGAVEPVEPELVEQQALRVQQVRRVQPVRVSVAVQLMRVPTRLTHRTLLSELNMKTGFAANGGPIPVQSTGAHCAPVAFQGMAFPATRALVSTSGNA